MSIDDRTPDDVSREGYDTDEAELSAAQGVTPPDQEGSSTGAGGNPAMTMQEKDALDEPTPPEI